MHFNYSVKRTHNETPVFGSIPFDKELRRIIISWRVRLWHDGNTRYAALYPNIRSGLLKVLHDNGPKRFNIF